MMKQPGETGASKLAIGWIEPGGTRRDAIDYAKGYAHRHFDSADASWYAVMPFMDGWFYELQENGSGRSYLPGVAKALATGTEESWIRVGNRVMTVGLREGKPYCVLMAESDSRLMEADGGQRLTATTKMQRVVKRGTGLFYSGLAIAVVGFAFFSGAAAFHYAKEQYPPSLRQVNLDLLPHHQWERVGNVPINLFVERLELVAGEERWQTTVKPIQRNANATSEGPIPLDESIAPEPIPVPIEEVVDAIVPQDAALPDEVAPVVVTDDAPVQSVVPAPLPSVQPAGDASAPTP